MIDITIDTAPCYYFSFTDDRKIASVNRTLCDALGYEAEELAGTDVERIFTLATRIFYQTHFFPLLRMHGHAEEIFISLLSKAKDHVPVLINARRESSEAGALNICVGIIVNNRKKFEEELINARKTMEAALRENTEIANAREELRRHVDQLDESLYRLSNQNRELKQFNKIVTHDLQEPLRKLSFFVDILINQEKIQSPTIPRLIRVTEQMRSIVSGLQQYVWLNEHESLFSMVDMNHVVAEAGKELRQTMEDQNWDLHTENLPPIEGNADQLQKMFFYVLENAVKFRKPQERAVIRITGTVLEQNRFRSVPGKYDYTDFLRIRISDNGTGFDASFRDHVFELFKKLHHGPGRGLGLALAKKIVHHHNGEIEAESSLGEGTTITVSLPVRQD